MILKLRNLGIALSLLTIITLTGCELLTGGDEDPIEAIDPATLQMLLDAHWSLFAWGTPENPSSALTGTNINLSFSSEGDGTSGTVSGSAGCNTYSGSYVLNANSISISSVGVTRMFCSSPEGIMDQEERFLNALGSANTYEVLGGQLDITFGLGGERLFFVGALP